ncbi:hypothetical protein T484DRAFT_1877230 [Baffinella frigidus]|nr:hypothetical protein T484DRAFT_1877230 [Cryptophyta sp. CCMP2293]
MAQDFMAIERDWNGSDVPRLSQVDIAKANEEWAEVDIAKANEEWAEVDIAKANEEWAAVQGTEVLEGDTIKGTLGNFEGDIKAIPALVNARVTGHADAEANCPR